jgi:hypothetical protein
MEMGEWRMGERGRGPERQRNGQSEEGTRWDSYQREKPKD